MAFDNGFGISNESQALTGQTDTRDVPVVAVEEVETLEGVDITKYIDVKQITPEEAKRLAAEVRAKERPIDFKFIEKMKAEGVTEELAVKAFKGRFRDNEAQTRFFLNADFYYGSDAPTPLTQLVKAVKEETLTEYIELLEGTRDGLDRGDHF